MSFFVFFLYLTISIIIYGIIGVLIYNVFFKKKKRDFDDLLDSIFESDNNTNFVNNDRKEEKDNEKIYSSF